MPFKTKRKRTAWYRRKVQAARAVVEARREAEFAARNIDACSSRKITRLSSDSDSACANGNG